MKTLRESTILITLSVLLWNSPTTGISNKKPNQQSSRFDVTAFGATGDGTTDDTHAIQSAIDKATAANRGEFSPIVYPARLTNGNVYFPCGRYIVTSLSLYDGVTVEGTASTCVELYISGTISYNHNYASSSFCAAQYISMRHITLRGRTGNEVMIQNGINTVVCSGVAPGAKVPIIESRWDDVIFENAKSGIRSWTTPSPLQVGGSGGWNNRIEDSEFHDLTEGLYVAWQDSLIVANTFQQVDVGVKILGIANHFEKNSCYRVDYACVIDAGLGNKNGTGGLSQNTYLTNHFEDALVANIILDGGDFVLSDEKVYRCIRDHTSSVSSRPPNPLFWELVPGDRSDVGEAIIGMGNNYAWNSGVPYFRGDTWGDLLINNFWLSGPTIRTDRHNVNQSRSSSYAFAWLRNDRFAHFIDNYGANTTDMHVFVYGGRSDFSLFDDNVNFTPTTQTGTNSTADWVDCHKVYSADRTCTTGSNGAYWHLDGLGLRLNGFNSWFNPVNGQFATNQGIAFNETGDVRCLGATGYVWSNSDSHRMRMCNAQVPDTIVGLATTDTLKNKSLANPHLTAPTIGDGSTLNALYKGSGILTYSLITAPGCREQPLTITGASTGDTCWASIGTDDVGSNFYYGGCRVSERNVAQVKLCSTSSGTPNAVSWTGWALH